LEDLICRSIPKVKITIDSQHLRVYVILARTSNLSRAAEELHMTPSGVSHCLKALEADLGCRLFDRNSRKFVLSQVGREFLAGAEQILDEMKSMRSKISTRNNWRQGQLLIGANSTACQFLLPPVLREFRESFPGFTIKIEQCSSRQAVALLMDERLDLALLTEGSEHSTGIEFNPVGEDDLQFILNPLHRWAIKRKAQREDIPNGKLILPERSGNTYAIIESYFRTANIHIQPFIEIANEQAIKAFIRLDMGVGILPRWLVADEIKEGLLVSLPLGRTRLKRRWGVLHSKKRTLSLADNLFINISRSVFRSLVQSSEI
jgi:LysR family transcriptional regulator, low CO2-responsive transcriptional regulator